ncbi:RecQ family ATP-dependent DNA helicase [Alkalihalobacillus sp. CinArs1]|uniref:RecQ family ATP-dependent DNA helicase n=1 Tax=Alkalihalobacillus sp. CinArs1 TaxID=2995314 RepID=UPI0022DE2B32|nr:ATP-dependent DNA helicase RecQ [Alkalihalobacillus sp. CinArs1]
MNLTRTLIDKFGYEEFRMGQEEIIRDVLEGKDVFAMLPTGAGKSLCYQLPAYLGHSPVLIVSPLVSLMEDQVQQLKTKGEKRVLALNSFLDFEKRLTALQNLSSYTFIFASPEILQNNNVKRTLKKVRFSLMVVDEAHCISQWGHDFRTDYLKLGDVRAELGQPPLLALTATATEDVRKDIIAQLNMVDPTLHIHSVDRPNIAIKLERHATLDSKMNSVLEYGKTLQGPGIIYFSSRAIAEQVSIKLSESGVQGVAAYHAGLDSESRLLIQQQFINDELSLICSTNAFGMGINKSNVRYVVHFHPPSNTESYLQEIGRAGRDQEPAIAIQLFTEADERLPISFIETELPERQQISMLLEELRVRAGEHISLDYEKEGIRYKLSETAWRFIIHHLHQKGILLNGIVNTFHYQSLLEDLSNEVERLRKRKLLKWIDFKKWLYDNQCRRKGLLERFDEDVPKIDQCCDYCGLIEEVYMKQGDSTLKEVTAIDWDKELQFMLRVEEKGEE